MNEDRPSHASRVGALFDAKASGWGDKYAAAGRLTARLERFEVALRAASIELTSAAVLDFGCGSGDLANHLARVGCRVTGVDISRAMLDAARARFGESATWVELPQAWKRLPFDDETFDVAVSSSALEYVPEVDLVMREVARVLKRGGLFALTVPDAEHPVRVAESVARAVTRKVPGLRRVLPKKAGAYADYLELSKNRFGEDTWAALGRLAGLEAVGSGAGGGARRETLRMMVFRRA